MLRFFLYTTLFMMCTQLSLANTILPKKRLDNNRGYCGDGMVNGNEDCDGSLVIANGCNRFGYEGDLRCQENCVYDISGCFESALKELTKKKLGGLTESCRCQFDDSPCKGECSADNEDLTRSACDLNCEGHGLCRCEGMLENQVKDCDVKCMCMTTVNGTPDCDCTLSSCNTHVIISSNIGDLILSNEL